MFGEFDGGGDCVDDGFWFFVGIGVEHVGDRRFAGLPSFFVDETLGLAGAFVRCYVGLGGGANVELEFPAARVIDLMA